MRNVPPPSLPVLGSSTCFFFTGVVEEIVVAECLSLKLRFLNGI